MNKPNFIDIATQLAIALDIPGTNLSPSRELVSFTLWDSVTVVAFAAAMAEQYGCSLGDSEIGECLTVQDLADLVTRKLEAK